MLPRKLTALPTMEGRVTPHRKSARAMMVPMMPGLSTACFRETCLRPPMSTTPWLQLKALNTIRLITPYTMACSPSTSWIRGRPMKPTLP